MKISDSYAHHWNYESGRSIARARAENMPYINSLDDHTYRTPWSGWKWTVSRNYFLRYLNMKGRSTLICQAKIHPWQETDYERVIW